MQAGPKYGKANRYPSKHLTDNFKFDNLGLSSRVTVFFYIHASNFGDRSSQQRLLTTSELTKTAAST
jgi:hypothetical protein